MTDGLLQVAHFERDYRLDKYSRRINAGELADVETATIDYQCWVAIAEWLETARFFSFTGGADPDSPGAPIIRWPDLETAAQTALTRVTAKLEKLEAGPNVEPETLGGLRQRRSCLFAIHRKVQLMRESVDAINHELRGREAA